MVKVNAPMFSFDARGQVGKSIVYTFWKGLNIVRRWVKPQNPDTADQQTIRGQFADAVARWQAITEDQQTDWEDYVGYWGKGAMSGFNLMVGEYITYIRGEDQDPPEDPWDYV